MVNIIYIGIQDPKVCSLDWQILCQHHQTSSTIGSLTCGTNVQHHGHTKVHMAWIIPCIFGRQTTLGPKWCGAIISGIPKIAWLIYKITRICGSPWVPGPFKSWHSWPIPTSCCWNFQPKWQCSGTDNLRNGKCPSYQPQLGFPEDGLYTLQMVLSAEGKMIMNHQSRGIVDDFPLKCPWVFSRFGWLWLVLPPTRRTQSSKKKMGVAVIPTSPSSLSSEL